jgi:hypothetical protein
LDARPAGSAARAAIDRERKTEKPMNMKLVSNRNYVAGWLNRSIHDFLQALSPNASGAKYALITRLDSHLNPASLRDNSPELKPIAKRLQVLGSGLLVPTELLLETERRRRIFFGFDEVWFFPTKSITPKPPAGSLVGPARLDQTRFNKIGRWMSANACSMALGGGEGLNFVVHAQGWARILLEYLIEQADPSQASLEAVDSRQD